MCLYPRQYINKKYTPTEKNGGDIPSLPKIGSQADGTPIFDERVTHIQIPCGQCIECRQAKAREWQVRLSEEYKQYKYNYFITLTFAPKELQNILYKTGQTENNAVAAYALRHCLERYRKDYKKSLKHWFITELGHESTERIHMHGLIMSDTELEFEHLERKGDGWMCNWKYWRYGIIFVGDYVNQRSINYVVKYMEKIDTDHKGYIGQVLCSPGIGKNFVEKPWVQNQYKYRPRASIDYFRLDNGSKVKLPTYYKNKLYNEEERELIWREFMDFGKESVMGNEYRYSTTENSTLGRIKQKAQEVNKFLGYGDESKEWRKRPWNVTKRMLQQEERNRRFKEMSERIRANNYEIAKKIAEND